MMRRRRASIAIEAAISLSIALLALFVGFGTLLANYVDDEVQWSLLGVRDELSVSAMLIPRDRSELLDTTLLSVHSNVALGQQFHRREIDGLVNRVAPMVALKDDYGNVILDLSYHYRFPSLSGSGQFVIPGGASVRSDGIDFEEETVYITNTGVKYHRDGCFHLRKSKYGIPMDEAKARGYEACKNCHGMSQFPP
ncbi:MAG: hypothetical protein Q4A52_01495 [Bacillota bacterium]|nr:hypothetical protein [Bacillota bacterium]